MKKKMKKNNINFEIKQIGDDGTFSGYASIFNNVDLGADLILKGAFKKTLKERSNKIKLLWQHDQHEVIGIFEDLYEDNHGLYVKGRLALNTRRGSEAYELLKMGAIDSMSIGYNTIKYDTSRTTGIRTIKEVKLFEASLVTIPMNESAVITDIKSGFDELKEDEKIEVLTLINRITTKPLENTEDNVDNVKADDGTSADNDTIVDDLNLSSKADDDNDIEPQFKHLIESLIQTLKG